jgi:hypothetical protein
MTRLRTAILVATALLAAALTPSIGDWFFPLCAARQLTGDPYDACQIGVDPVSGLPYPLNPLTTALMVWPVAWLPDAVIASLAGAVLAGVLTWALLRTGESWRLWALLSAPLLLCLWYTQWPPLMLAAWHAPVLWPVALLIKPHTALPAALLRWRAWPQGAVVVAGVGLLSLIVRPLWPWEWLANVGGYSGGPALLQPWGPLLLLALLRWRDERARYLLLCAVVPLRGLYDLLILFALPTSQRGMLLLCTASWAALAINGGRGDVTGPGSALLWLVALGLALQPADQRGGDGIGCVT